MNLRETRVNLLIGTGHFLSHFYQLCLPPLFFVWQREFGITFAELGLIAVLMASMTAALQTPLGFLVDRFGARPFLIGGALLMSLSISAMSLTTSFWQILVLALFSGMGNAVFHPCDYAILAGSIRKEKMGRAFALHSLSGNMGFVAAPPLVALLAALFGWREALLILGLLGVPVVAAIIFQSSILVEQARHRKSTGGMTLVNLLTNRTLALFFLFYMLSSMAGGGITAWLITVLHQVKGLELAIGASALTGYMVGNTAGTLIGGWAADRLAHHLVLFVIGLTVVAAALLLYIDAMPMTGVMAISLMFLVGTAFGSSRTPRDVMLKDAAPAGQIGKVFGFVSTGLPLGGALTPVPFGFLIDHNHPSLVLVLVAILLMASLLCMGTANASATAKRDAMPAEAAAE